MGSQFLNKFFELRHKPLGFYLIANAVQPSRIIVATGRNDSRLSLHLIASAVLEMAFQSEGISDFLSRQSWMRYEQ